MKRTTAILSLGLITFLTSCVKTEVLSEKPQTLPEIPPVIEEVMPTDTLTIEVCHTSDTIPSPELYGTKARMVNSSKSSGRTVITTVGTGSFTLTGLADIDTIRITTHN